MRKGLIVRSRDVGEKSLALGVVKRPGMLPANFGKQSCCEEKLSSEGPDFIIFEGYGLYNVTMYCLSIFLASQDAQEVM